MKKKILWSLYFAASGICCCFSFPILLFTLRAARFFIPVYLGAVLLAALVSLLWKRAWAENTLLVLLAVPFLVLAMELTAIEIGWLPFPG